MKQKSLLILFIPALIVSLIIFIFLSRPGPPGSYELDIYFRAAAAYDKGDFTSALNLTAAVSDKCPGFAQARLLMGKAQFFSGMISEAEKSFEDLIRDKNNYYEAEIWNLRCKIQEESIEEAKVYGEELLSRSPEDPRILGMLARISVLENDCQKALEFYQRAVLFEEELAINRVEAAKIYFSLQNTKNAALQLEKAAKLADENSPLQPALAELIKRIGANE